jgi:hypothetical protein
MNENDPFIQPDDQNDAQHKAEELFVHGLLGQLHEGKDRQKARVEKALQALDTLSGDGSEPGRRRVPQHRRFRRFATLGVLAILIIAGVIIFEVPIGASAYATVSASLDAAKGPGQRRYELRLAHWPQDQTPEKPTGTLDSADGTFLLRFGAPDGHEVIVGKDKQGEWGIRLDGGIERERPRTAWPRWAEVGDDAMLGDSVDHLLEGLLSEYDLSKEGRQTLPGAADGSRTFKHVHGDRKPGARKPQPDRVDLWIDPDTNVLERLEMNWPKPPANAPGDGPGRRPRPDGQGPGPDGDRRPDGPGPDGPEGDRRPDGPDSPPPAGEGRDGPPDDQGDGPHPPRRRPPPPGMGGPDGPPDGPPGPRQGPRGPRPRISRLILSRVDAPAFDEGWFSPEKYQTSK